jgi:hypothetical protein
MGAEITRADEPGCDAGPVPVMGVTVGRRLLPHPAMPRSAPAATERTKVLFAKVLGALRLARKARAGMDCWKNSLIQ